MKYTKNDYQYWLNADFYQLVMRSRFKRHGEPSDEYWEQLTRAAIAFGEKYVHFGGKFSVKLANALLEARKAEAKSDAPLMPDIQLKQMMAEFYRLQEQFHEIYNCEEWWMKFTQSFIRFGEKYKKYAGSLSSQIALAYVEGKQDEHCYLKHMASVTAQNNTGIC